MAEEKITYETGDIGLATYLDYWIGWIECQKYPDGRACFFVIKHESKEHIDRLVQLYEDEKDFTPAKAFRRKYKQVSIMIERTMNPRG